MWHSPLFDWGKNFSDKFDLSDCKNILDVGCRKGDLSAFDCIIEIFYTDNEIFNNRDWSYGNC